MATKGAFFTTVHLPPLYQEIQDTCPLSILRCTYLHCTRRFRIRVHFHYYGAYLYCTGRFRICVYFLYYGVYLYCTRRFRIRVHFFLLQCTYLHCTGRFRIRVHFPYYGAPTSNVLGDLGYVSTFFTTVSTSIILGDSGYVSIFRIKFGYLVRYFL